jgi:outer membrane protein
MRRLILSGVIAVSVAFPSLADTTSLKQALEATYRNNPTLAQTRESIKNLDETVVQALAGLKPTVEGSISVGVTDYIDQTTTRFIVDPADPLKSLRVTEARSDTYSNTATLSISQLLFDGGQTRGKVDSAKLAVYAGREKLIEAEQGTLLGAITAYMDLRRAQANLNLAQSNIKVLEQQLQASRDRFEVGEVTRTDVSQTEARLASAISNREASRAALQGAVATYESVVGDKPHRMQTPPEHPAIPSTLARAEALALKGHPRIRAAQLDLKAAGIDLTVARRNRIPTVRGSVSATTSASSGIAKFVQGNSKQVEVNVSASIPIFQGGRLDSQQRSASNAKRVDQYALDLAINTTQLNIRRNYANWQAAVAAIRASQAQIRSARIAFEGVQEEAKLGSRTTLDVLDAEQELLTARSNLVSALRDEQVQAYNVLAEMGRLTARSLRLNVEHHDPKTNYEAVVKDSPLGLQRINLLEKLQNRRKK